MGWWGGSHCSPGEFLTVFSLLTCPGELDLSGGISHRRPDLSGGASFSSLYKCFHKFHLNFYVAFPFVLKTKFLKSILYYCLLIHS